MQKKKIISGIVALTLLLTTAFSVCAEKATVPVHADESLQSQISPMFTYIAAIGAGIKISDSTAICTGTLTINKNYSCDVLKRLLLSERLSGVKLPLII